MIYVVATEWVTYTHVKRQLNEAYRTTLLLTPSHSAYSSKTKLNSSISNSCCRLLYYLKRIKTVLPWSGSSGIWILTL